MLSAKLRKEQLESPRSVEEYRPLARRPRAAQPTRDVEGTSTHLEHFASRSPRYTRILSQAVVTGDSYVEQSRCLDICCGVGGCRGRAARCARGLEQSAERRGLGSNHRSLR